MDIPSTNSNEFLYTIHRGRNPSPTKLITLFVDGICFFYMHKRVQWLIRSQAAIKSSHVIFKCPPPALLEFHEQKLLKPERELKNSACFKNLRKFKFEQRKIHP